MAHRGLLAVLGWVVLGGCVNLADKLILWPPGAETTSGATRELVATPRGAIEVFVARSDRDREPEAFVLRFYGNADLANRWIADEAAAFGDAALEFWGVNYLGFGGSEGDATLSNVALSARAAFDALAVRAHGRPIIVIGSSLGTTAALHVAARRGVAGLVLENPPPLRQLVLHHGWWNLWLLAWPVSRQVPDELDSIANARRCTAPAVFISARRDRVVPVAYQQQVMDAYRGDWRVFDVDADHNDLVPDAVQAEVRVAIRSMIDRARSARGPDPASGTRPGMRRS